ncbi:hypothetical protein M758_12G134900 [Ceratodon purpureus]|nr:hypothetical protein M758_12G134900 [Ceratodon purpureus]
MSHVVSPTREMGVQASHMARDAIHILGSYSNRSAEHETLVEIPKLMSQLVDAVYEMKNHPDRQDAVLNRVELELGYTRKSGIARNAWYEVFLKSRCCKYSSAPDVVVAVRGTVPSSLTDWKSNGKVLAQILDRDERFKHLKKVVEDLVEQYGHTKVSIAGHSLGAAFALLVGKVLAKAKKPIDAFLFNPPCPSVDIICSRYIRKLEMGCRAMILTILLLLCNFSIELEDRLLFVREDFRSAKKWTPHLFLNKGDLINVGYINQLIDNLARGDTGFMARLSKWVAPHTLLSLITRKASPKHLLPSAKYTIADSYGCDPLKNHAVEQWYKPNFEWKSGTEVGGLKCGRQIAQRAYYLQREYNRGSNVMMYTQSTCSTVVQAAWSTMTWGVATSKQKQPIFMFNTERDAEDVQSKWPATLTYCDMNNHIEKATSFEFLLRKFQKGAVTFYIYAVKRKQVPFERECEWNVMLDKFTNLAEVTNWIKIIRTTILTAVVVL